VSKRKLKREKEAYNTKEEKEEGADSDSAASETESLCLSPDEEDVEHSKAPTNMLDLQKQLEGLLLAFKKLFLVPLRIVFVHIVCLRIIFIYKSLIRHKDSKHTHKAQFE